MSRSNKTNKEMLEEAIIAIKYFERISSKINIPTGKEHYTPCLMAIAQLIIRFGEIIHE